MTTFGDTLTPTISGVSIKVEQGVFCENNDDYKGCGFNLQKRDIPPIKTESNNLNVKENDLSSVNDNMFGITHSIFQPDIEFKAEPEEIIDDRQPELKFEASFHSQSPNKCSNATAQIVSTESNTVILQRNGRNIKKRFFCSYDNCTKSYGKSSHLRSHLTWHTGLKPFVCKEPDCGRGFTRSDELNRHIRTHTGEKPFECVQCTKKFSRSDHLSKHLATHRKQLQKKIKLEKKLTNDNIKTKSKTEPLTNIENQNDDAIATQSIIPVQSNSGKIKLQKSPHTDELVSKKIEQEIKVNSCQIPSPHQLESRLKDETNVVVKSEPLDESHNDEPAQASFTNEPDDDAVMPEANLPPLLPSSMNQQKTNQSAGYFSDLVRPYPCSRCTKRFKRQDDLNRHMRTHTGEKPFACNECDKRFMRSDHLKKHMNTHTRVR